MSDINPSTVGQLSTELRAGARRPAAIALDFDGVCKLFTAHKHQIMRTCLFLHLHEFQRVPFPAYQEAYAYINFRSPDYAGKERFLCVDALARHLAGKGYRCGLPGLHAAVAELKSRGQKIAEKNLLVFAAADDVARAIAWSREVNEKVARLTEIGLTPGLDESILRPFRNSHDFYVVSTATGQSLPPLMLKEGIDFILRYVGQETATKAESLLALCRAGYQAVFMFGDSVEDTRASRSAEAQKPESVQLLFVPVIPDDEERCFATGRQIIESVAAGNAQAAQAMSRRLADEFEGKEVGAKGL